MSDKPVSRGGAEDAEHASCTPNSELLSAGCLLCGRYFKNHHGASIHIGKIHNKRPVSRGAAEGTENETSNTIENGAGR